MKAGIELLIFDTRSACQTFNRLRDSGGSWPTAPHLLSKRQVNSALWRPRAALPEDSVARGACAARDASSSDRRRRRTPPERPILGGRRPGRRLRGLSTPTLMKAELLASSTPRHRSGISRRDDQMRSSRSSPG